MPCRILWLTPQRGKNKNNPNNWQSSSPPPTPFFWVWRAKHFSSASTLHYILVFHWSKQCCRLTSIHCLRSFAILFLHLSNMTHSAHCICMFTLYIQLCVLKCIQDIGKWYAICENWVCNKSVVCTVGNHEFNEAHALHDFQNLWTVFLCSPHKAFSNPCKTYCKFELEKDVMTQ